MAKNVHLLRTVRGGRAAFTLIELMIVVAIMGILASLAMPMFQAMVLRSRTAEVPGNLNALFKHAATYYSSERASQGQNASVSTGCTIVAAGPTPATPQAQKQLMPNTDPGFIALGFSIPGYVYFSYGASPEGLTGACGGTPNDNTVYTLYASGDLDTDGTLSSFELAVGSDPDNQLFHAHGIYIENELE